MSPMIKSVCACSSCVSLCENPGWLTPDESRRMMDAGYAAKMMLDYLVASPNVYVLCPASFGCEGQRAPNSAELGGGSSLFSMMLGSFRSKGRCVFLGADSLCGIHDSGFKPTQCREAFGCIEESGPDNYAMAELWKTAAAQAIVAEWMKTVGLDAADLEECF